MILIELDQTDLSQGRELSTEDSSRTSFSSFFVVYLSPLVLTGNSPGLKEGS
jgi:hypothetical protein